MLINDYVPHLPKDAWNYIWAGINDSDSGCGFGNDTSTDSATATALDAAVLCASYAIIQICFLISCQVKFAWILFIGPREI